MEEPAADFVRDAARAGYPPLTARLLAARGIEDAEAAERFLAPDWERDTHDPFLMKDMARVCERVTHAMERGERIALWSDYDMDGIPGAVVLWDLFRMFGYAHVVHHTPHRNKDGFGLNAPGLDALKKDGVSLVITIDCGIADNEHVAYANSIGLEVIVTDHHIPGETLPPAYAILNPKQADCAYPEPMLCGAGVAFKLVQGLLRHLSNLEPETLNLPPAGWEKWLLDMVGMATIADMVPLTGENRAFAHYGLVVLRKSRRPGLQALLKKARARQQYLTEEDIGFTIAPRINAASRMGHAADAFRLLSTTDEVVAAQLADELEKINAARKGYVAAMVKEARTRLAARASLARVVVLGDVMWKPSLLGLVANTLAEEYERPVFLWGREEGVTIKGSCRSYNGANVHGLMQQVSTRFIEYGGHAFSGGFSIAEEQLFTLEDALDAAFDTAAPSELPASQTAYRIEPSELDWPLYRELARFAPFGEGNPRPLLELADVALEQVRTFGKANEHLEVSFRGARGPVHGIAFFTKPEKWGSKAGDHVTLTGYLEASYFKRTPELRMRIVDISIATL